MSLLGRAVAAVAERASKAIGKRTLSKTGRRLARGDEVAPSGELQDLAGAARSVQTQNLDVAGDSLSRRDFMRRGAEETVESLEEQAARRGGRRLARGALLMPVASKETAATAALTTEGFRLINEEKQPVSVEALGVAQSAIQPRPSQEFEVYSRGGPGPRSRS